MPKKYKPEPDWKPKTNTKTEKEEVKAQLNVNPYNLYPNVFDIKPNFYFNSIYG